MAIKRPRLKLTKGQTYTFDVSNAALATHPFKFTADSGTSEYTTGVTLSGTQGQAGASISWVVDSTAPTNLNYYCGTHGIGMGNHIVITAAQSGGGGGGGSAAYSVSQIDSEEDYEQIKSLGYESQMPTAFNVTFSGDGNYMYTSGNALLIQYGPLNTPYDITSSTSSTTAITWGVNGSGWDHMSNAGMIEPYKDTISSYQNYSGGHGFYSPYEVYEPFMSHTDAIQSFPRYHQQTTHGAFSTQSTNNSQTIGYHYDDLNIVLDSDVNSRQIKEHIRWLGDSGAYFGLFSKSYGSSYGAQLAVWSQPGDAYSADGYYSYGTNSSGNKSVATGWAANYVGGKDLKGIINNYHSISESSFSDYEMNNDGTIVWLLSRGTKWLYELTLTTPYNPKTATYNGTRFAVTMFSTPTSLHWNESRKSLFIGGDGLKVNGSYTTGNAVIEYKLGSTQSGGGGGSTFNRALFSGGTQSSGGTNTIEYMAIPTGGATTDFGDMTVDVRGGHTSFGNSGRTIFANGQINNTNTYTSSMEYVNPSTPGNGASFGTNDTGKAFCGAVADLTRGVIGGGTSYNAGTRYYRERMDYVTINTTSSSTSFGSLGWGWAVAGSASSGDNTYGCWSGGVRTSDTQYVGYFERITIQTTGSSSSFGSFSNGYGRAYSAGFSDTNYSFTAGGINGNAPTYIDHIDRHSITTGGTGTNVASLSATKYSLGAANNPTHAVIGGGYASQMYNNIENFNMSTNAIASTFGTLSAGGRYRLDATSGGG